MPRRNNRATPPTSHKLSRFERWAKRVIEENQGQADRIDLTSKKDGKEVKKNE